MFIFTVLWILLKSGYTMEAILLAFFVFVTRVDYMSPQVIMSQPEQPQSPRSRFLQRKIHALNWRIIFNKAHAFSLLRMKDKSIHKSKSHNGFQRLHTM